ncbi:DUF2567 domain-containing protein [Mycolicibacterium sp. XJ870]
MSISNDEQDTAVAVPANVPGGPRISRSRAVVIVVVALTIAGALFGVLWAWLAPPIRGVVALTRSGERIHAYLGSESDHFFTAAFMFVGLLVVLAVVSAVALWQWRAHRGPVLLTALAVGCAAAAAAAAGVGAALVHRRYGTLDIAGAPVTPEDRVHYVVEAAPVFFGHTPLQLAATILFPAAMAALAYALIAVSTPRDDLGAWPPAETPVYPALPPAVSPPMA